MIRVGIDLERIERFAFVQKPGGDAFYRRVYTLAEQLAFGREPVLLALCYTAKEAVSKALGTGMLPSTPKSVSCLDIEILYNCELDQPLVTLKGEAQVVARQLNLSEIMLYWHHNRRLACAIAGCTTVPVVVDLQTALQDSLREIVAYLDEIDERL